MATKNTRENKNFRIFLRAALLMLLPNICLGAPSFNPKQSWQESVNDNLPTILASSCNPATGRCWGLLPIADSDLDDYAADIAQPSEYGRPQVIHVRDVERESAAAAELWRNAAAAETATETRGTSLHNNNNQLPMTNNRLAKKDFLSRGWGAGGMPFSVLYMSPRGHSPSSNSDPNKSADSSRRTSESSTTSSPSTVRTNQSNYRVSSRNGSYNLPRRHYSIIPQLFVSYGWGPSGK